MKIILIKFLFFTFIAFTLIALTSGFMLGDTIFIVIGLLLLIASTIAYLGFKKVSYDPYR